MIEVRNLAKSYQSGVLITPVLKDFSFRIEDGELCAIIGPSGSGKSTLMNILGCLDTPTCGEYLLDGEDVAALDETARTVSALSPIALTIRSSVAGHTSNRGSTRASST